jgi:alkylation response protein AidB-like acyl-CoA dehydrogenase
MDFEFTPDQKAVRDRVAPLFSARDARTELLKLEAESDVGQTRHLTCDWLRRLGTTGYLALGPASGRRGEALALLAAQEVVARASGSLFLAAEASARLFGALVAAQAAPALRDELLPRLHHGDLVGAVGVAEAEPPEGPAPLGLTTEGRPEGRDVLVTGRKLFVTNGPIADWIAVAGRLDGALAFFLVPRDASGELQGARVRMLGFDALTVSGLELRGVRIPRTHVLGPFADTAPLDELRVGEDLVLAVAALGLTQRTLDAATDHARRHRRGGRPIVKYQDVGFRLAEMLTLAQTARLLCCRAAWQLGAGDPEAPVLVRCAKVFVAEAAEKVASAAVQITAGEGFVRGSQAERSWREAKYPAIAGTTSELSRLAIADALLARY